MKRALSSLKSFYRYALISKGRSSKLDYWVGFIFIFIMTLLTTLLSMRLASLTLMSQSDAMRQELSLASLTVRALSFILLVIPFVFLGIRRLHDANKSGWFLLICIVASILFSSSTSLIISYIPFGIVVIYGLLPGTVGVNNYGNDPKDPAAPTVELPKGKNGTTLKRVAVILSIILVIPVSVFLAILLSR